ncbi:AMP-binding protein [Pendulispora brunnea]|uniref:AMP-binding protein n=1 Tax=Pendulispora brunnea TaxID=2905690 RepID=A0ABZ2K6Z2_9BACT
MRALDAARLCAAGGVALVQSGVIGPVAPWRAVKMGLAAHRNGVSPAMLAAVSAARWPNHPAILDERGTLTYAELERRSNALAAALAHDFGVGPQRALAVMCRNHRGFVESMLAAAKIGADVVLLNTEIPGPQLARALERHTLGAIVHDEEFAEPIAAAGYRGPRVLAWHDAGAEPNLEDLIARQGQCARRPGHVGSLILLTSGTTGAPKGVPRKPSLGSIAGAGITALSRLRLRACESTFIAVPLFHGFGMVMMLMGLMLGSTLVLQRRFVAEEVAAAITRHRVTTLGVVPVMLQRLLAASSLGRGTALRAVLSGGAPLVPSLATAFMDAVGDVLYNGYGSSEVGIAALATPADLRAAPGTVGRPVLATPIGIVDDAGAPVAVGRTGRILVGGEMVFGGYSGGGSKEMLAGLMSTGDVGHFDAAGRLFIDGRVDEMIVSGGENVFPQGVEHVLGAHDDVIEAAVIGVPDAEFGQRLRAFVVLRSHSTSIESLEDYVRRHVARYEVPRDIVILDELPRNATGKILRSELRAMKD